MKRKMQYHVQPEHIAPPRIAPVQVVKGQVQEEIKSFLRALDSYPARVARDPGVSFHQHLSSFFGGARNQNENDRRARRQ
jgi:hypothetical protein